jgi:hypothetical protein
MTKHEVQIYTVQLRSQTLFKTMQPKQPKESPSGIFFTLPRNRAHQIGL